MKKTRSDVVISVGPNNGKNDAFARRSSLLDRDDEEPKKSVAFGPDVVDADVDAAADDPTAQPDCCDLMCPTNYIESMLCRADEALCVCSITDNFEAVTGIQLCADDDDEEDIAGADDDDDDDDDDEAEGETARGQVKAVDNSLVKPDSSSNTTCDETASDAEASVGNTNDVSRSSSVVDESSGIALQKDISVLEESSAPASAAATAAADTLEELIQTEKKENEVDTTQDVIEEGSILSDTLTAFGDMLRNPFPEDVSPIKKATTKKATAATTSTAAEASSNDQTPETVVESASSDNARDDATSNDEDMTSKKDQKATDDAATTQKEAPADLERIATSIREEMSVDDVQMHEKKDEEPTAADAAGVDKASPADITDHTANITTGDDDAKETNANDNDNDNDDDDLLNITSDLQQLETDATSRRIRDLLKEAYGEHSFSADELDGKCRVLRERYAGREALLVAALEKKIRKRREAMEAVERAHKTALGELEGASTGPNAGNSAAASTVEAKKAKTRRSKLGKAKSLVKKFPKFSPKTSKTAAAC